MGKVTRVRSGCWTCKRRRRKCDEAKPFCKNCLKSNRTCEGYGIRLKFDVNNAVNYEPRSKDSKSIGTQNIKTLGQNIPIYSLNNSTEAPDYISHDFYDSNQGDSFPQSSDKVFNDAREPPITIPDEMLVPSKEISSNANLQKFSSELFEGLEYLLHTLDFEFSKPDPSTKIDINGQIDVAKRISGNNFSAKFEDNLSNSTASPKKDLLGLIEKYNRGSLVSNEAWSSIDLAKYEVPSLSYKEENMVLKHFFQKLLPLLDAHPNSPWPHLALKYCDFDIARNCFLSLACIHMYESRMGGEDYYNKGVAYINNTMDFLIKTIASADFKNSLNLGKGSMSEDTRKFVSMFIILVLINVHILFAVLDKGKSSMSRYFFKIFATICNDTEFYNTLIKNDKKRSLAVVLSWYDTISAVVSPDCRLPYCNPDWYGTVKDESSTEKLMACPGEIFKALSKVCFMRHEAKRGNLDDNILSDYEEIKLELINYRSYVQFEEDEKMSALKLKGAQCWALAVYVTLVRVVNPPERESVIRNLVNEFIDAYGTMDPSSPVVTQMVWPVYAIGCECKSLYQRKKLIEYMDTLYLNCQMGTLDNLRSIVRLVWDKGVSQEVILEKMLPDGIDYLPL